MIFAIFSLRPIRDRVISRDGTSQRVNADPSLTTNHLPLKGDSWLSLSVPKRNPTSASTNFQRQKARLLPKWNCPSHPITASLRSFFRTKLRSRSIWNRVCKSLLKLSVGSQAVTNPFAAGDPFTAFNSLTPNQRPTCTGLFLVAFATVGHPHQNCSPQSFIGDVYAS
jgi:hypothetical protein